MIILPGMKYAIYLCSFLRTIPGVSLHRNLRWRKNTVAVITQDRVMDGNFKRQIKNQTLHAGRLFLLT